MEPLLGAGATQPYKLKTGRRSTKEQHPIPALTRIGGGEGPLLPPSTQNTGPIQMDGKGVSSEILGAWSSFTSSSFLPCFYVGAIVDPFVHRLTGECLDGDGAREPAYCV